MRSILVIEDIPEIRSLLAEELKDKYRVLGAGTLREADQLLAGNNIDLILLDVELPDGDGYKYFAKLRIAHKTRGIPVIFVTGKSDISDKTMGFTLGADDYITKPFDIDELRLRIEARLRRIRESKDEEETVVRGDLNLNVKSRSACQIKDGKEIPIELTPIEFKLLLHLAQHDGELFDRDFLIHELWGEKIHVSPRTVDTHLSNLRKKIISCEYTVLAAHGEGYKFTRR